MAIFRSCWVPFRSPTFSACRRSFCPKLTKSIILFRSCWVPFWTSSGASLLILTRSAPPPRAIFTNRSGSTLTQVMACCQMAPSHYLNQCWLLISEVLWHSPERNFTMGKSVDSNDCNSFEDWGPIDEIYSCLIFQRLTETWLHTW